MIDEAKGTLNEDVISLTDKEKSNLINLSVKVTKDIISKKCKIDIPRKTTVILGKEEGIEYKIVSTKDNKPRLNIVEDRIRAIGLNKNVTNSLLEKYHTGNITQNHVSDIKNVTVIDDLLSLDQDSQMKVVEKVIENRNIRSDMNSSFASLILVKNGSDNKYIFDNWYRGILKISKKLCQYIDIDNDKLSLLSPEQSAKLIEILTELSQRLEYLLCFLKKDIK